MKKKNKSIKDLLIKYFKAHPKEDMPHGPVVDWVEARYKRLYNKKPRDIWRSIRNLHEIGFLIKVKKGVYRYDPDYVKKVELFDFSPEVKEAIFKKDGYECVWCGRGRKDGIEICVDHILPKDKGGTNTIDNGQTLCMQCNLIKKNYSQSEAGKRFIIKMYKQAVAKNDKKMIKFCKHIFDTYNEFRINSHIKRPNHISDMSKYKCKNCGYRGKKLIFQFNDYGYCMASNGEEPEYISDVPKWVKNRGDAEIGEPVGCPKCHSWGVNNFEMIS